MTKRTKRILAMMSSKPKLRKISGLPPLTYTAKEEGTLKDYRIYGQTVQVSVGDSISVGDRTANLFDKNAITIGYAIPSNGVPEQNENFCISNFIDVSDKTFCKVYNLIKGGNLWALRVHGYNSSKDWLSELYNYTVDANTPISSVNINIPSNVKYIRMSIGYVNRQNLDILMFSTNTNLNDYEPYGYKVPMTVEGINILPMSTTPISTDVDDFHCEYDGTGTITLTTDKDNAVLSSFSIPLSENFIIPVSIGQGGDGCAQFNNSISTSLNSNTDHIYVNFYYNSTFIDSWGLTTINRRNSTYSSMGGKTINRVIIDIKGAGFSTNRKIVIRPAFVLNTTEQVPFEPYHAPVTTPIYLPEPIKMVGDEAEYIEYGTQKMYRIGADDLDVTLPALPTVTGTNVLSVGTVVQPSMVEVTGRIRSVPTGGGE